MEKENINDYGKYIASVREKCGLNKDEFASQVYSFRGGKCVPFSYHAVKKWENSKNLPKAKETLLCIALLDFCGSIEPVPELTIEKRNERMEFVDSKMYHFLGKHLYTRSIKEMLLLQVARGIISIADVLKLQEKLYPKDVECRELTKAQTKRMFVELGLTNNIEDILELIKANEEYYSAGYKVLGARIKEMCKEVHPELSFEMAICRYAPQYHTSYRHVNEVEIEISREFLISICFQLGFNMEQTNAMLKGAQMAELAVDEFPQSRFWILKGMSLSRKFSYVIYLMEYFRVHESDYPIPYYFFIEGYLMLHNTGIELDKIEEAIQKDVDEFQDNIQVVLERGIEKFKQSIEAYNSAVDKLNDDFCERYRELYCLSDERLQYLSNEDEVNAMYRVATFSYMIFLEKEYKGKLTLEDLQHLKALLKNDSVYLFMNNFWTFFLDAGTFRMDENGGIYRLRGEKKTRSWNREFLLENLAQCCEMYLCDEKQEG